MDDDEWLNYILSWRENSSTKYNETIDNPYKFYATVSERVASMPRKRKRTPDKIVEIVTLDTKETKQIVSAEDAAAPA